jgi:hypothetical protein
MRSLMIWAPDAQAHSAASFHRGMAEAAGWQLRPFSRAVMRVSREGMRGTGRAAQVDAGSPGH